MHDLGTPGLGLAPWLMDPKAAFLAEALSSLDLAGHAPDEAKEEWWNAP